MASRLCCWYIKLASYQSPMLNDLVDSAAAWIQWTWEIECRYRSSMQRPIICQRLCWLVGHLRRVNDHINHPGNCHNIWWFKNDFVIPINCLNRTTLFPLSGPKARHSSLSVFKVILVLGGKKIDWRLLLNTWDNLGYDTSERFHLVPTDAMRGLNSSCVWIYSLERFSHDHKKELPKT